MQDPLLSRHFVSTYHSLKDYTQLFTFDDSLITGLLLGFAGSAAAYVGNMVFSDEGIKVEHLVKEKK